MTAHMRVSVLDQSPIAEGGTGAQALRNTVDLARLADELGYARYWVAEHHGMLPMLGHMNDAETPGPDPYAAHDHG
jgi:alkanesulfonate monooxygenase SsuD/methylene tetrahydromethanopterin reductase-like flavin-dependent oxidoreductase (luciferase family)